MFVAVGSKGVLGTRLLIAVGSLLEHDNGTSDALESLCSCKKGVSESHGSVRLYRVLCDVWCGVSGVLSCSFAFFVILYGLSDQRHTLSDVCCRISSNKTVSLQHHQCAP